MKKIIFCILATCLLVFSVFGLTACNKAEKLRGTGGTTDGKEVTEDTDPDTIVSQQVTKEEWQKAMAAFSGESASVDGIGVDVESNGAYRNFSQKLTIDYIVSEGQVKTYAFVFKYDIDQKRGYYSIKQTQTTGEQTIDTTKEEGYLDWSGESVKSYSNEYGVWTVEETAMSSADYQGMMKQEIARTMSFSQYTYENFTYNKKTNAYEGTYYVSGYPTTMEIKIINGMIVYAKQYAENLGEKLEIVTLTYDVGSTKIELPTVAEAVAEE